MSRLLKAVLLSTSPLGDTCSEETHVASFFSPLRNGCFCVEDVNML